MIKRIKELAHNVLRECKFLQVIVDILAQFEVING